MNAVLLCAGFATRMYPLTRDFPKPLLPVAGRPVLDYLLDQVAECAGISAVHLVSNARFHDHFCRWRDNHLVLLLTLQSCLSLILIVKMSKEA